MLNYIFPSSAGECSAEEEARTNCMRGHGRCGKDEGVARCICNYNRYGSRCQLNHHQWTILHGGGVNER